MRPAPSAILAAAAAAFLLGGCQNPEQPDDGLAKPAAIEHDADQATVHYYRALHREAGIARERTINGYCFELESARLNSVGERRVQALAMILGDRAFSVNVPRDGAGDELWAARREAVLAGLAAAGADVSLVAIVDTLPGGDGIDGKRVERAFAAEAAAAQQSAAAGATPGGTPSIPVEGQ